MKGFARAVAESSERVASRLSHDVGKLIDARSRELRKDLKKRSKPDDGPYAVAEWISLAIPPVLHQILLDFNVKQLASQIWKEQEAEHKKSTKAQSTPAK